MPFRSGHTPLSSYSTSTMAATDARLWAADANEALHLSLGMSLLTTASRRVLTIPQYAPPPTSPHSISASTTRASTPASLIHYLAKTKKYTVTATSA